MINVLIIASKPLVANLYRYHIDDINKFKVVEIVECIDEAKNFCKKNHINLIVLDISNELDIMKQLKKSGIMADIILLSSFEKMKKIPLYLELGMIDYLIKPFEYEDFKKAFENYVEKFYNKLKKEIIKIY
jgi:response regulator of citrate/malate metabolism